MEKEQLNQLATFAKESAANYAVGTVSDLRLFALNVEMIKDFLTELAAAPVMAVVDVVNWLATDKAANSLDEKTRKSLCDVLDITLHIHGNQQTLGLLNHWFEDLDELLTKEK